jgi:hypothetical protein
MTSTPGELSGLARAFLTRAEAAIRSAPQEAQQRCAPVLERMARSAATLTEKAIRGEDTAFLAAGIEAQALTLPEIVGEIAAARVRATFADAAQTVGLILGRAALGALLA